MACSRGRGDGVPALLFRPVPLASFIVLRRVDAVLAGTDGVLPLSAAQYAIAASALCAPPPQRKDKFRVNKCYSSGVVEMGGLARS